MAKLNTLSGACQDRYYCDESVDIDEIIEDADESIAEYLIGSDPQDKDRQHVLKLKDLHGTYSNSKCD